MTSVYVLVYVCNICMSIDVWGCMYMVDWSKDQRTLRSTCGAYELLYWDVGSGKQLLHTEELLLAGDGQWHTHTCVLGFEIMGIWPAHTDGTDINALDVCRGEGHLPDVVVTADDFGRVTVFNYPCVATKAPGRKAYGHGMSNFHI